MTKQRLSTLHCDVPLTDRPFAVRSGKTIPVSEFINDVQSFKVPTHACRVALIMDDSYDFIVALYALLQSGCCIICLPNDHPNTLEKYKAQYDLVVNKNFSPPDWRSALQNVPLPLDVESLCFYTSGSTGDAKRIVKTIRMLEQEVETLELGRGKQFTDTPQVYATVPHYHLYGLTFKLLWSLAGGRPFRTGLYETWEGLVHDLTPYSIIISSPAHLKRATGLNTFPPDMAPQFILSAGSPLPFSTAQEITNITGCIPTEAFGSTETGVVAMRRMNLPDTPWQALEGVSIRRQEDGRMAILSPYAGQDWFVSNDLIELDDQGFRFIGRTDAVVKIEGKRVNLDQVEKDLLRTELLHDVVAVMDRSGKLAVLCVLSSRGSAQLQMLGKFRLERQLRSELSLYLPSAELPKIWRFVEKIPVRPTGKRDSKEIQSLLAGAL